MTFSAVIRYTILTLSSAVMISGILVLAGILVPVNLPEQFRIILGTVVFLYGAYRFVIAYIRKPESKADHA